MESHDQDLVYLKLTEFDEKLIEVASAYQYEVNNHITGAAISHALETFLDTIELVEDFTVGYSSDYLPSLYLKIKIEIYFKCHGSPTWHLRTIKFE